MKKLITMMMLIFIISSTTFGQTKSPKWITEKCTAMKEQIKTDLQLTAEEADKYYQIIVDKYTADAEKLKTLTTEEEKKAYHSESFKNFMTSLKTTFGDEKAQLIQKWTKENQAKFNKKPTAQ